MVQAERTPAERTPADSGRRDEHATLSPQLMGAVALVVLDLGIYVVSTLAMRTSSCSAPRVTTPLLDCFWDNFGNTFLHVRWAYFVVSLVVSLVVGVMVALSGGNIERGATAGGIAGLLGSAFEILILIGILVHDLVVWTVVPHAPTCSGPRCVNNPALTSLMLVIAAVILGSIIAAVTLFHMLCGITLGAVGGWLGEFARRFARARITPPASP